jgi:GTPase SAR1 family protein
MRDGGNSPNPPPDRHIRPNIGADMKYCQLVVGPAGSGKSTYCSTIVEHLGTKGRSAHVLNLDPAADTFGYKPSADVRDLVSVSDAAEELGLGPNGGLLFCMEHLEENMSGWLQDVLSSFTDEDYLLLDCPGQIELFTHLEVFRSLAKQLSEWGWTVASVFLLDSQFVTDAAKFTAGVMTSLSSMLQLETPFVNVLSKIDLLEGDRGDFERFLTPETTLLLSELNASMPSRRRALNDTIASIVDEYSLVNFVPLNISDEDSIDEVLLQVDLCLQYGEDSEPRTMDVNEEDDSRGMPGFGSNEPPGPGEETMSLGEL